MTFPLYLTISLEYKYCNELGYYCYYRELDKISISLYNLLINGNGSVRSSIYINNYSPFSIEMVPAPSGFDIEFLIDFGMTASVYLKPSGLLYSFSSNISGEHI